MITANKLRQRKLLVILGAGSSSAYGMPSVADIDNEMKRWSREWKHPPEFPNGAGNGVFNDLWQTVAAYHQQSDSPHLTPTVTFERVLGEMTALSSWVTPSPFGNALRALTIEREAGGVFGRPDWPQGPYFHRQLILEQYGFLLESLARHMRKRSTLIDRDSYQFKCFEKFLARLAREFDVGVYNLNYDDIAISAWPDAFSGFDGGVFDARKVCQRIEWGFIYHLHGSVHYSLPDALGRRTMCWRDNLKGEFNDCRTLLPDMASGFKPILPTTLIAGGSKLDQLLRDPFQTFHAALVRHVHEADAVLIAGYGFGDVHVNRALQGRFDLSPFDKAGRPPIVVLDKSNPALSCISNRQHYDFWTIGLTHAFNTRFNGSAGTVDDFVQKKVFEVDMSNRTAIWHGGFVEAFDLIDDIISWLQR